MAKKQPLRKVDCLTCEQGGGFPVRGDGFSRRNFLRFAGTGLVASYFADVLSPNLLFGATSAAGVVPSLHNTAKNCIFIFLSGAPSHADLWDLKEGPWTPSDFAPSSYAGGSIRFPQGLMPKTAAHIDKISFIRSGLAWAAVHPLAQQWTQISRSPTGATGAIAPHIGAVVAIESQLKRGPTDVLPAFIALNSGGIPTSGYLPAKYAPFGVNTAATGLSFLGHPEGTSRFSSRWNQLHNVDTNRTSGALGKNSKDMNDLYDQAKGLMDDPGVDALFSFNDAERMRYGSTTFGDGLLVAKQLVGGKKGARFVQVTLGGWDHHSDIYDKADRTSIYGKCAEFDPAYAALLADLSTTAGSTPGKTLLDETLVVVLGEFGRTVGPLSGQAGRDHFLRFSAMMAGGGVKGSRVIGKTDSLGDKIVEHGWSENRDIRPEDITCTIYSALGVDYTIMRTDDPLGRGFEYVPYAKDGGYKPIEELF
ncbi:MAG TPA: DUF1501 domain-containing protein [Thermoanaerobaculia bacterium]|nr:DUF1501 domain-containing protein [Thermoanaerobaculia bacterium]